MHGQEPDTGSYLGTVINCWTEHVTDLANASEAKDDVKTPPSLMNLANWEMHCELWLDFLALHHNLTTGVPLTYILHELADVPAEDLDNSYPTINEDLIVTTKHCGQQFYISNQHVFGLYKQLIVDGLTWAYAKAMQRPRMDVKPIFLFNTRPLRQQPTSSKRNRCTTNFLLPSTVGMAASPFKPMSTAIIHADLDEPVTETKKVTNFMNGTLDPTLAAEKMVVNGDAHMLSNFEACQQYFCTLDEAAKPAMGDGAYEGRCEISLVKCGRTQHTQQKQEKPHVHAGHYEMKEWNDLMDDEKVQVSSCIRRKSQR